MVYTRGAMTTSPVSAAKPEDARFISYADFLAMDGERAEWVRGEVVPMMSVSREHQLTGAFLISLLREFVTVHNLGAILYDPYQIEVIPGSIGRAPDLVFVAADHLDRLHEDHLEGPADLVVEIVSPGTAGIDRGDKFYEYEAGGVREYWLIDPVRQSADFYTLNERGIFRFAMTEEDGNYRTNVLPGLRLNVEWLWTRPSLMTIAAEAGLLRE